MKLSSLPSFLLAFLLILGAAVIAADVRVKDVATTATVPASDDYLLLDGTTNGTRKFLAPRFLGNTTVTFSGVANITTTGNITGNVITGNNLTVVDAATTNLTVSGAVVGVFLGANGGTGVANTGKTITLAGNITTSGANNITLTTTGATSVTLPTSGTLATLAGTETLTNKRVSARITSITSSATPTVNTDNCDVVTITALAAAITSMTTNLSGTPDNFDQLEFRILDNGTARAITWGSSFASGTGTLPTTTTVNKALCVYFEWDSVQAKWMCQYAGSYP